MWRCSGWFVAVAVAIAITGGPVAQGHTPIASRWTYNEHLFPIFRENCGACHLEGGIAPMSLLTYQEAFPWAQSIREEVLGLRMPPWKAEDGFGDFKNGHALPAHEMDMILEWSSGGYPQGPRDMQLEPVNSTSLWRFGEPTLTLEMPEPVSLDANTNEAVRYFVLPSGTNTERWITAIDFQPGASAIVRGVAVYIDTSAVAKELDAADTEPGFTPIDDQDFPTVAPVALWSPGQPPVMQNGNGYRLPARADFVVRIHYKKTWITEGQAFSDQSRVGVHLASGNARPIESILVSSPDTLTGNQVSFTHEIERDTSVLSLLPEIEIDATDVRVVALTPNGDRIPMLFIRELGTEWPTRYWFDTPVDLPQGTEVEVSAVLAPAAEHTPGRSLLGGKATAPIRVLLDFTTGGAAN